MLFGWREPTKRGMEGEWKGVDVAARVSRAVNCGIQRDSEGKRLNVSFISKKGLSHDPVDRWLARNGWQK